MAVNVLTYADYAALPNDGKRYEILDGELFGRWRRAGTTSASS
jgi:hypothetical protein